MARARVLDRAHDGGVRVHRAPGARRALYARPDDEEDDARDRVVLDAEAPVLAGATESDVADRWVFSGNVGVVRDVDVAGARVVDGGRHRGREAIAARYRDAIATLLA